MKSIFFAIFIAFLSVAWLMADNTDPDKEKKEALRKAVKVKLDNNRKKVRLELDELAKKQAKDEEFQKLLKTINDNRKGHEGEEKPIPKGISELNANLDDTFQFDIMLNEEQSEQILSKSDAVEEKAAGEEGSSGKSSSRRRRRGAGINAAYYTTAKWPNAVVPYMFAADVPAETRTLIQKAMDIWQQKTCVTFQLNSAAFNKLYFTTAYAGCWSYVGRQSSWAQQEVSIGYGCDYVGIIAHEIGHALGFWHEQSRHDRDTWVYYNAANVQPGQESNFNKYTTTTNDNYGHRYDYGSLMHYADTDVSSNGQPVLIAMQSVSWQRTMGQRLGPSFYDFKVMNSHYQCQSRCATPITCYNGGIQNSRLCSECICPPGIGGPTCGLVNPAPINAGYAPPGVPNTCTGTTVKALATAQELTGQIGSTSTPLSTTKSDYAWCHWFISADPGYKIAIEVLEVGNYCTKGCFYGNMEIRFWDAYDWGRTGYRLCCTSDISQLGSVTTPDTRAVISLYTSYNVQRFRIRFWQVAGSG